MTERDRYIPGVPCWVDIAPVDADAAARFYGELFGWTFEEAAPPDAPSSYRIAQLGGGDVAAIASPPGSPADDGSWTTYIRVDDVDDTAARVHEAGGEVLAGPDDVGDAGRMAVFADAEGATFSVWQPGRRRGAAVVNEHGSVNFNDLHTGDLQRARAFYGAVFGWEVLDLGDGAMWALPGYGDFLEEANPGLRDNMAAMGAPERFEDVVASVGPLDDGAAPRWGVTFAVDDADEIARRAGELGATVVVPPLDAPWVRMTVIADPQGAVFTASQFVPPAPES